MGATFAYHHCNRSGPRIVKWWGVGGVFLICWPSLNTRIGLGHLLLGLVTLFCQPPPTSARGNLHGKLLGEGLVQSPRSQPMTRRTQLLEGIHQGLVLCLGCFLAPRWPTPRLLLHMKILRSLTHGTSRRWGTCGSVSFKPETRPEIRNESPLVARSNPTAIGNTNTPDLTTKLYS